MGLFFLIAGVTSHPRLSLARVRGAIFSDRTVCVWAFPCYFLAGFWGRRPLHWRPPPRQQPFGATLLQLWHRHIFENGPLWFAQALLIFAAAAVVCMRASAGLRNRSRRAGRRASDLGHRTRRSRSAAASDRPRGFVVLRQLWPVGVNVWGLQLGYFAASYVVLFAFGSIAAALAAGLNTCPHRRRAFGSAWRLSHFLLLPLPPYFLATKAVPFLAGKPLGVIYAVLGAVGGLGCHPGTAAPPLTDGTRLFAQISGNDSDGVPMPSTSSIRRFSSPSRWRGAWWPRRSS